MHAGGRSWQWDWTGARDRLRTLAERAWWLVAATALSVVELTAETVSLMRRGTKRWWQGTGPGVRVEALRAVGLLAWTSVVVALAGRRACQYWAPRVRHRVAASGLALARVVAMFAVG